MKIRAIGKTEGRNNPDFIFFCPACQSGHGIWTTSRNEITQAIWTFDGNMERPTISPSVLLRFTEYDTDENKMPIKESVKDIVCHSVITNGMIAFQGDCTHELKNQTIELPEF